MKKPRELLLSWVDLKSLRRYVFTKKQGIYENDNLYFLSRLIQEVVYKIYELNPVVEQDPNRTIGKWEMGRTVPLH